MKAHEGMADISVTGFVRPQILHLQEVADLIWVSGGSEEEIAAAWLHDSVEDASIAPEEIEENFGQNIARIVEGLGRLEKFRGLPVATHKMMQAETIKNESESVRRIKMADQISNVRFLGMAPIVAMSLTECRGTLRGEAGR